MKYISPRGFGDIFVGVVKGAGWYFKEDISSESRRTLRFLPLETTRRGSLSLSKNRVAPQPGTV